MTEPLELLRRASTSRGLRLRGDASTLRRFRRKLMYERTKDSTFAGLVFKLKGEELQILNSGQALGELEETLW